MTQSARFRFVLIAALAIGAFLPASQAAPRDELLRLVPDDMMFCIVLQDLREHAKRFDMDDSFVAALKRMPFARQQMNSPEFKKLLAAQQHILKELNVSAEQLRDDLLGDAVVFAYRQGNADRPDREHALLLVKVRDAKLLVSVVDRINEAQKKTGELRDLRSTKHGETDYIERLKLRDGKPADSEFYLVRHDLLVFSQSESALKEVIDRYSASEALPAPFWPRLAKQLGIDKPLISFLLNPRAFDAELATRETAAVGSGKAFLKEFRNYWKAFDGVGAFADIGADFELGIAIHARKNDLPAAGQRLFAALGKPSALWSAIPDDCLLALGARIDAGALVEVISGFIEVDQRKAIHKWLAEALQPFLPDDGNLESFLKGLGPDWGFWMMPPASGDKSWVPQAILAVRIPNTPDGAVAEATARSAIQFLFTAAQLSKDDFKVETIKIDMTSIKCLSHPSLFPAGLRPSFAVKDGHLLIASSPETIGRFHRPKDPVASAAETPLLRISGKAWRAYLGQHKTAIADFFEKASGTPAKEIAELIDQIAANLEPFDRLEIGIRGEKDRATLILRLKTAKRK